MALRDLTMWSVCSLAWLMGALLISPACAATYYVDAQEGHDSYAGTSPERPWRTIWSVNAKTFKPGDVVLFRRGREWNDVSIRVSTADLTLGAYGVGAAPRLIGGIPVQKWESVGDGRYRIYRPHEWGVQLVVENEQHFYRKIESSAADLVPGTFYYDKPRGFVYLQPLDGHDPSGRPFIVGSQNHVIELQNRSRVSLTIKDLEISYANRFGVSPWWQGGQVSYGSVAVEGCRFIGNAFSAIALSGNATYDVVTISDSVIRKNGAEGIYIGIKAVRDHLLIADNVIGSAEESSFGWRGEGAESPFNGDGIDIKWGNQGVQVLRNRVTRVRGRHGITTQSSGSLIAENLVTDVYLPGSRDAGGISTDVQGVQGAPVLIRDNTISGSDSHGIVLRGNTTTEPPVIVENNRLRISGNDGYSQIGLLTANNANITIRKNEGRGGTYGVYMVGLPPKNLEITDNFFANVERIFFMGPKDVSGMRIQRNRACIGTPILVEWPGAQLTRNLDDAHRRLGPDSIELVRCVNSETPPNQRQ